MIFVTRNHSGKMKGLVSINTSSTFNPFCIEHSKIKGSICEKCYARRYESFRPCVKERYNENGCILSSFIIRKEDIPVFNERICRFHSYGELINGVHLLNFVKIAKYNPETLFVLWTKRIDLIRNIVPYIDIPKNLKLIYSAYMINCVAKEVPKYFDATFSVVTKKYAEETGIKVNCRAKNCLMCQNCYSKDVKHIVEICK